MMNELRRTEGKGEIYITLISLHNIFMLYITVDSPTDDVIKCGTSGFCSQKYLEIKEIE